MQDISFDDHLAAVLERIVDLTRGAIASSLHWSGGPGERFSGWPADGPVVRAIDLEVLAALGLVEHRSYGERDAEVEATSRGEALVGRRGPAAGGLDWSCVLPVAQALLVVLAGRTPRAGTA